MSEAKARGVRARGEYATEKTNPLTGKPYLTDLPDLGMGAERFAALCAKFGKGRKRSMAINRRKELARNRWALRFAVLTGMLKRKVG